MVTVRNNGKRHTSPDGRPELLVGDEKYDSVLAFTDKVFPRRTIEERISVTIPAGVTPTQFRITSCCRFFDTLVPFYNEWVVYDLG